jgi:hypothetical protein
VCLRAGAGVMDAHNSIALSRQVAVLEQEGACSNVDRAVAPAPSLAKGQVAHHALDSPEAQHRLAHALYQNIRALANAYNIHIHRRQADALLVQILKSQCPSTFAIYKPVSRAATNSVYIGIYRYTSLYIGIYR